MNRPAHLPSALTLFDTVLGLRGRLAGLFLDRRAAPARARLAVETMEERLVLTSNPLPNPALFVGSGGGDVAVVRGYNTDDGTLRFSTPVSAFGSSYTGGLNVSAGDFTGDGTPDAVVSAATGTDAAVTILDGTTGATISGALGTFTAYTSITGGGVVTATGDVEGNGVTDLITAAQTAGGLEIKVFSGTDGAVLADFDVTGTAFSGAVSLAAGDFTGSGRADVVVGGSGGWVDVYDPVTGSALCGTLGGFQAFGPGYTGGAVSVAADPLAGVANPGATSVLAVGTGAGATTEVKAFDAAGAVLQDIRPFGSWNTAGAQVALAYISDPLDPTTPDIVVGSGPGTTDQVRVFSGTTGVPLTTPSGAYSPFGATADGVFVAAENDPGVGTPENTVYIFNGSTSAPSLMAGQTLSTSADYFPSDGIPVTGEVTFTLYDSATTPSPSTLVGTWTEALALSVKNTTITPPFSVTLSAGSYTLQAAYSGDANYAPIPATTILSLTVAPAPTTTTVSSSASPAVYGQPVTFTAAVSATSGTPTGTVTFRSGSTVLGSGTPSAGGAVTLSTSGLAVGSYSVTAVYSGDTNFNASTSSPLTETVNKAPTTTTLTSSSSSLSGEKIALPATVAPVGPGAGNPTGTVTFYDNGTVIGSVALSGATATLSDVVPTTGSYTLTATYSGDTDFDDSASSSVTQTVNVTMLKEARSDEEGANEFEDEEGEEGAEGNSSSIATGEPVEYSDGVATIAATDLESDAFGTEWDQARTWSRGPADARSDRTTGTDG